MNDIYGITFFKTFSSSKVTNSHCYLLCRFKVHPLHEPSGSPTVMSDLPSATSLAIFFLTKSMKLNTDCAFRACFCLMLKHVGIMLEWCLTRYVWQHFGRLFTPIWICVATICREVEVGSGSAAARAAGTQRSFPAVSTCTFAPNFLQLQEVSSDFPVIFFPQKNNKQHQFPAPVVSSRWTSQHQGGELHPAGWLMYVLILLILVGKKRLGMTFWWCIPIIFAWERGGNPNGVGWDFGREFLSKLIPGQWVLILRFAANIPTPVKLRVRDGNIPHLSW